MELRSPRLAFSLVLPPFLGPTSPAGRVSGPKLVYIFFANKCRQFYGPDGARHLPSHRGQPKVVARVPRTVLVCRLRRAWACHRPGLGPASFIRVHIFVCKLAPSHSIFVRELLLGHSDALTFVDFCIKSSCAVQRCRCQELQTASEASSIYGWWAS